MLLRQLPEYFRGLKDFRKAERISYQVRQLLLLCIVERILEYATGHQHDHDKTEKAFVTNMMRLSLCMMEYLPHSDTLRYFLKS